MIDASFEEVKFAINNDLQGMQAVSAPLKIVTWFLVRALNIYHNIRYQHRLRGPQGVSDGKPVKQATNHPKTRQKRAGSVFTACMSMRTSA